MSVNKAARLVKAGSLFEIGEAPLPTAGPGELVVRNAAVAINPLDCHMQDSGVFVQQWPAIIGCDVTGVVHQTGSDVQQFKKNDRVIEHAINLTTGRSKDGAFALYTVIRAEKAAILPDAITFTNGVVVPFALDAAVCALSLKSPSAAMSGVETPALSTTARIYVPSIVGAYSFELSKSCGATEVFGRNHSSLADKVIDAIRSSGHEFLGIFDAISTPETYGHDNIILTSLGGGHLACVHPPPSDVPADAKAGMVFAVNDVATPVWKAFCVETKNGNLSEVGAETMKNIADYLNTLRK